MTLARWTMAAVAAAVLLAGCSGQAGKPAPDDPNSKANAGKPAVSSGGGEGATATATE